MSTAESTTSPLLAFHHAILRLPGDGGVNEIQVPRWEIHPGDFWLLGGFPGSGKSTLLAAAAGLWPLYSGSLDTAAAGPTNGAPFTGLVFDRAGRLFRDMTVRENVAMAPAYHELDADGGEFELDSLLREMGLGEVQDRFPAQIQRSLHARVALARALAIRPRVLLLDDPLSGVDPMAKSWWRHFLRRLRNGDWGNGMGPSALVVACADAAPLLELSTRLGWIENGGFTEVEMDRGGGSPGMRDWLGWTEGRD